MELPLETCTIRSWTWDDRESLVRHANNPRVAANLRDRFPSPYTEADADAWLAWVSHQLPETSFAIEVDGQAVGGIGFDLQADVYRRSAELGYWLGEDYWGRGIMTEAVRAVSEYAFVAHDLCRLYAGVFASNPASARVLEKAGYSLEAVLRRSVTKAGLTMDQLLYARVT